MGSPGRRNALLIAAYAVHLPVIANPYFALLTLLGSAFCLMLAVLAEIERAEAEPFPRSPLPVVGLGAVALVASLVVALGMGALSEALFGAPHG